ncbi:MAG: phosphoribosylformylglycinamidine synthase subunit PurQ [Desulfobacteraceae bacterium]|nr:phosphoribosylformylglycinamidine synthase subunit PurQ [Desulfobacteraceae bacterium]
MTKIKALVLTGFGLNCDVETAYAFELAGAEPHRVHINSLINGKIALDDFQILALGGGFSWGDDHGAGVIQALKFSNHIGDKLLSFIEKDRLIIGICNGFQTLVNLGLLPGFDNNYKDRLVSITWNDCGNFRDQWVHLSFNQNSPCVFTKGIDMADYPVRHGEGKFIADQSIIDKLVLNNQIALQYSDKDGTLANNKFPLNPNGSIGDIAGICDPTGRIFGLMPHPEAYNHFTNHPDWTREKSKRKRGSQGIDKGFDQNFTTGIKIFKNGVDYLS